MLELDEADTTFIASMKLPEGAVVTGFCAVVTFVDPETGENCVKPYSAFGMPITVAASLLSQVIFTWHMYQWQLDQDAEPG